MAKQRNKKKVVSAHRVLFWNSVDDDDDGDDGGDDVDGGGDGGDGDKHDFLSSPRPAYLAHLLL